MNLKNDRNNDYVREQVKPKQAKEN